MTKLDWPHSFALLLLVALSSMSMARADSLTDPTRPAPEWLAAQTSAPGTEVARDAAATGLQVIVIGPARSFAIIDGQMVRYGDTHNGARLVDMQPGSVVLQKDGRNEKLSMSPAVTKKIRASEPVAGKFKSRKEVVNGEGQ